MNVNCCMGGKIKIKIGIKNSSPAGEEFAQNINSIVDCHMKRLILICAPWTLLTLTAGLLGVWRIHTHPLEGVPAEVRAAKLGLGIGALTATGYALMWLILALTARKTQQLTDQNHSD
jgi:hypothetical protein